MHSDKILIYGTKWCPDCRRARMVFEKFNCPFEYVDIEADETARAEVSRINNGFLSVPTILFPDGSTLTEPDNPTLERKIITLQEK